MNEEQTKHDLITPALHAAGWEQVPGSRLRLEFPITAETKPGSKRYKQLKADYVLVYRNRRIGIVEAKAKGKYYTEGVGQAKDYADRLHIRFTYATNGVKIYQMDMEDGQEGDVATFPSPDELWEMTFPSPVSTIEIEQEGWRTRFDDVPYALFLGKYMPRYFQRNAAEKVLEHIARGETRLLLTMATGTGKTATAFHICWKLFKSKWNLRRDASRSPRILFLADRNILADQAFNAFGAFAEDALVRITPKEIKKKGQVPKNGSIFFTIFQSFMSGPVEDSEEGDDNIVEEPETNYSIAADPPALYIRNPKPKPYFGEYPKDFFDFIIIDECHRGGAKDESTWRGILEYFSPAVQLGLTATPKRDVNRDTYHYFGEPVYSYSLKDGINDGFLSPFRVKEIATTEDDYIYTPDDIVLEGEIEEGRAYSKEDQNKIIQIMDIERYRVKIFMDMINQNQKTLVFCATQIHAAAIRDLINQYADSSNAFYCCRVTADDGAEGERHLKQFQDNERSIPTVLTTSQKLSTGVDAPEVRNIVLLRPVKSMVEFKQIVGRGTRLFEGKDYFTVYDFMDAHNHFQDPEWDGPLEVPDPCNKCNSYPCVCPPKDFHCNKCDQNPCVCEGDSTYCETCDNDPCVCEDDRPKIIKVKLGDGKSRSIDSMIKTTFWSPSGTPITSEQFLNQLFGDIPTYFSSEAELRKIWSLPSTRNKLLNELSDAGYSADQLNELRKLVNGTNNDLFDVLTYVAYHKEMVPRSTRASKAKISMEDYNAAQQSFLNFVLEQYVDRGVSELDDDKLPELLELKYTALDDAKRALGSIPSIRKAFIGFQERLYG